MRPLVTWKARKPSSHAIRRITPVSRRMISILSALQKRRIHTAYCASVLTVCLVWAVVLVVVTRLTMGSGEPATVVE